jgi:hypothetical protein
MLGSKAMDIIFSTHSLRAFSQVRDNSEANARFQIAD